MLQQVTLKGLRIPHSAFRIPDSGFQIPTVHKPYKNMADSKFTFHRLLLLLLWVKTIATWKTVIESMQSLGMEWHIPDFSLSILRILLDFCLHDGETPAKWQGKANFATHPSTETEWPPKRLTRFSS